MSLHFINENMKVYNVECEYIGINKSVLLSEILRLNEDLYFGDKNIINNWNDMNENEKIIKELLFQIKCKDDKLYIKHCAY